MMCAYSESYESCVMRNLGRMFEIALNEGSDMDDFAIRFSESEVASGIENGFPLYLAGRSGAEMFVTVTGTACDPDSPSERGPEYWAGTVLAYAQRRCCRSFSDMLSGMSFTEIASSYHPLHEADITKASDSVLRRMFPDNPVKTMREKKGLTQRELSEISGLGLGTIRAYEQNILDIRNASAGNVYMLSKALGCSMERLLLG